MTVEELRGLLNTFEDEDEVVIGQKQMYGCDWMYKIRSVDRLVVSPFYDDDTHMVVISEGCQEGTVDYDSY